MNYLDIINKLEKEYQINIAQYNNLNDEYDEPNYFSLNKKNEITELILTDINDSFDLYLISSLTNLKTLALNSIRIKNINRIDCLENLLSLSLSEVLIEDLSVLKPLTNLTYLELNSCGITDISVLKNFKKLTYLGLRNNKISDISSLENLKSIETLFLWNNHISNINVLSNLNNLKSLDIGSNYISDLLPLCNLHHLILLDIVNNKISDLRPLENLILKNFDIVFDEYNYDEDLENYIFLQANHFTIPPIEVIKQGNDTIIQYFEDARIYNLKSLNECKLIFVGDGGLGKTSLMKKIIGLPYTIE